MFLSTPCDMHRFSELRVSGTIGAIEHENVTSNACLVYMTIRYCHVDAIILEHILIIYG